MKVSELRRIIENKIQENQKAIKFAVDNHDITTDSLIVRKARGKFSYYKRTNSTDTTGIYLGSDKTDEIESLERMSYFKKLKKTAEKNIVQCENARKALEKVEEIEEVFWKIPEERKHLIQPYRDEIDEDYAKKWLKKAAKTQSISPEGSYRLSNGVYVRSKSEVIIAERFIAKGVPFFYEPWVLIDHVEYWLPDFLVLNKRTKESYIWEHFGMMDKPDYSSNVCGKITTYARNDILLGKDLIISMESSKNPLDTEYIDEMIKKYLL